MDNLDKIIALHADITDEESLIKKGLCDEFNLNDKYLRLYKNYKILLDKYLLNKLSLYKYENMINNSNLKFIPLNYKDMDYYQYISSIGLNYIYITNDIYVEKLSNEDINTLLNLSYQDIVNPNQEIINLIDRTYEDIITDNYSNDNQIKIGIRRDDYADNGIDDEVLRDELYQQQQLFLNNLIALMQNNILTETNKKVDITLYNEFNIDLSKELFTR